MRQLDPNSTDTKARKLYYRLKKGETGLIVYRSKLMGVLHVYEIHSAAIQGEIDKKLFDHLIKRNQLKRLSRVDHYNGKQWLDTYTAKGRDKLYGN